MWTNDPPMREGFYWLRFVAEPGFGNEPRYHKPTVVNVLGTFGDYPPYSANFPGNDDAPEVSEIQPCQWWDGPIEEPPA